MPNCSAVIYFVFVQEYKPPSSKDIPIDFRVTLLKDAPNHINVLGSKGTVILYSKCVTISMLQELVSHHW